MPRAAQKFTDRQKAAMVIIAMGEEKAAKVYRHLNDEEVEDLTLEVASFRSVDSENIQNTVEEFNEMCKAGQFAAAGGVDFARKVLERAYGPKDAIGMISRLSQTLSEGSLSFLKKTDHKHLFNFIQNEHPQTIALILLYTTPEQAAAILSELPREKQIDVAMRIATMDRTSPEVIHEIEQVLEKKLSMVITTTLTEVGGVKPAADILNRVDRATEKFILDEMDRTNHELSEMIRSRMFVFEDIVYLDARSIQRVLRDVSTKDLAVALKGSNDAVKNLIFSNMTKRMQETISEEIGYLGPIRLREVEEAQQKVVHTIRKLEESNQITVNRNGEEDMLV